ncbi:MAG: hypothetical protein U0234_05260 [Sandaracinus sp.]
MSRWLVIVLTALLVSVSGIETLEAAFVVESHQCEDDDDSCPPFSDDCGDCARCVHVTGVPTTTVVLTWMPFPDRVATPSVSTSATPPDAPTSEILTVPRA